MLDWLRDILLGMEPASWADDASWRLRWLAWPSGDAALLLLLLAIAGAVGLWLLYRFEARRLGLRPRLLLTFLRALVLALVAAMLLEPVLVMSRIERVPSSLLVLVDSSASMGVPDAWTDAPRAEAAARAVGLDSADGLRSHTRSELVRRLLDRGLLDTLAMNGDRIIRLHPFADRLEPVAQSPTVNAVTPVDLRIDAVAINPLRLDPTGRATAIGSALQEAMTGYHGLPLAGVLLITDGRSNNGPPPHRLADAIASEGVPVVALAMGTPEGPRHIRITDVDVSEVVFQRDANAMTVHFESRGLPDTPTAVRVDQRRDGGAWQTLDRRDVVLAEAGRLQSETFAFREELPGRLNFRVEIEAQGIELAGEQNIAFADVRVIRQRLRVLLIAGTTFPEVQFLRNAMLRDRGIEVATWLQVADERYEHPGDSPIRRLPSTQAELDEFDCIVLYDPDPNDWPLDFGPMLHDFVTRAGGGMIYVAGEQYTAQSFDHQSESTMSWLRLLPVVREPGLFRSAVQMRLSARRHWQMEITPEGRSEPIFAFAPEPAVNERILSELPGMFWHFPVTRAKPGAAVLARHGDPRMTNEFGQEVLLATQRVGPGRTFFVGFDSTYRWRYLSEDYFDGFWARMIDRAGRSKLLGGNYPFRLTTDRTTYPPGSQVTVHARFDRADELDPIVDRLHGQVERGDDPPLPLAFTASNEPGHYTANFPAGRTGTYMVNVWMGEPDLAQAVRPATMPVTVELPNIEFDNPTRDRTALEDLANRTHGRVLDLHEVDQLASAFPIGRVDRLHEQQQELWNAPLLVGLLLTALFAEWLIRKRCRLI